MSATIIHVNALATAIVTIDPSAEATRIAADYEYYRTNPEFIARQAVHDADVAMFGGTRIDLAWAKAQERAGARRRPSWDVQKANFLADLSARRYASALGVALA
jgi:hypothetical protein